MKSSFLQDCLRRHLAPAGEYLPALRARPLGEPVAKAPGTGRSDYRPLCRRLRAGIPVSQRRSPTAPRTNLAVAGVRFDIASREDPLDRVRPLCGTKSKETGRRETGNVRLSGLHALLRESPRREFPYQTQERRETHEGDAGENQISANRHDASTCQGAGTMAAIRGARVVQLPRRTLQSCGHGPIPQTGHQDVASRALPTKPKSSPEMHVETHAKLRETLDSTQANSASPSRRTSDRY